MVTKKRTKKETGGTAAEKTAAKKSKEETKSNEAYDVDELFNQLADLKKQKDSIEEQEKEIKAAIKESGFDEKKITTTKGYTFTQTVRNNYDVHKPGTVKALGKDTFIKYAKINASDIKKAIGDAGLQDLIEKGTVQTKEPTVYYTLKKK